MQRNRHSHNTCWTHELSVQVDESRRCATCAVGNFLVPVHKTIEGWNFQVVGPQVLQNKTIDQRLGQQKILAVFQVPVQVYRTTRQVKKKTIPKQKKV